MMKEIFSIIMAMTAYTCISAGFVLMKKGISWIGWKDKKNKKYFLNLFLWISGFVIMNIYGVPSAIALRNIPAYIVAAFAGWGIIVLVFLSHYFLKEKIYSSDYFFSIIIVIGIILLNIFNNPSDQLEIKIIWMIMLGIFPLILFLTGFLKKISSKIKTIIFALVSGISAGLMVVFLSLLVLNYQYKILLYFNSIYLYLYIGFALLSFFSLQIALKMGEIIILGPVQYSANIIYPLLVSLLALNQIIVIVQFLAILLIIYSLTKILKKH